MKALVKAKNEPGLWLQDVPVPEIGISDVLIRVSHASICGTDLHIYKWDEWAAKTIPVPMVVGHEFVGVIVEGRLQRIRLSSGRRGERRGTRRLRPLPQLSCGTPSPVRARPRESGSIDPAALPSTFRFR